MMMFPKRLKTLREMHGMNQEDIARAIGVSKSTIGMYEQGRREPDFTYLITLAKVFNVSTDYLLGYDQKNNNEDEIFPENTRELVSLFKEIRSSESLQYINKLFLKLDQIDKTRIEERMETLLEAEKYRKKGQNFA